MGEDKNWLFRGAIVSLIRVALAHCFPPLQSCASETMRSLIRHSEVVLGSASNPKKDLFRLVDETWTPRPGTELRQLDELGNPVPFIRHGQPRLDGYWPADKEPVAGGRLWAKVADNVGESAWLPHGGEFIVANSGRPHRYVRPEGQAKGKSFTCTPELRQVVYVGAEVEAPTSAR